MRLENDHLRGALASLKSGVDDFCSRMDYREDALDKLHRLACLLRYKCCSRRLEVHFLPAMREQVPESGPLVMSHDVLHQQSLDLYASVCQCLCQTSAKGRDISTELEACIKRYCQHMFEMLDMEEGDLFSLAQEKLSRDDWFMLASAFIWEESDERESLIMEPDEQDLENNCLISISESGEKTDSEVKYKLPDNFGLQSLGVSSLHFGNG